ncbi:MAG: helix-turn-helix domain-containing protein [Nanoarchaeota archaeon]|nr:helix-turn-helix domain-containing protein [Nanoarchaeota archaeon]
MESILSKIGLTKNEINVYTTLLKLGNALAGEITSYSGVHRRNVYDAIERLIEKGLVSFVIINNRKCFKAANPSRLLVVVDEQKNKLDNIRISIQQIIPHLRALPVIKETQDVMYFKGKEGLKTVYEDILSTGNNYIGYGRGSHIEHLLKAYIKDYVRRRIKLGMELKMIWDERSRGKDYTKTPLVESRFLPDDVCSYAALRIYGNKVALMLFSEEQPLAVVIENKAIADGYKKYFEVMWKAAKS